VWWYNKYVPRERNSKRSRKKFQKVFKKVLTNRTEYGIIKIQKGKGSQEPKEKTLRNFKKPLDKPHRVWYNKDTIRVATNARKEVDTMTIKKITKREKFEMIKAIPEVAGNEMLVEFIDHELELLAKKNASEKKPTAQQVANDSIKQAIIDGMEANRLYTVTEIQKEVAECAELSNQRVSALMRQLKEDGLVVRTEEKRKAYFSKA
jgi:hypothetical protein